VILEAKRKDTEEELAAIITQRIDKNRICCTFRDRLNEDGILRSNLHFSEE